MRRASASDKQDVPPAAAAVQSRLEPARGTTPPCCPTAPVSLILALFAALAVPAPGSVRRTASRAFQRITSAKTNRGSSVFARALLRNPRTVGAFCPSSARLARAVAAAVDVSAAGYVVELGGGTGALTSALLERGVPPQRLVVIERDPTLARHLRQAFRAVTVICGDAAALARIVARLEGQARVDTVVSSLPLISLSADEVRAIGAQICAVLERGGLLVQYTYQIALRRARLPRCLELVASDRVWINLPPARVEVYRHRD